MGIMPFHLEKGVMGLRFDYLTRTQEVRDDLRSRLGAGADAFDIASGISITWLAASERPAGVKAAMMASTTAPPTSRIGIMIVQSWVAKAKAASCKRCRVAGEPAIGANGR